MTDLRVQICGEDEALLRQVAAGGPPRCTVCPQLATAVVLGRGSDPARELHLAACRADGVPILRRRGGGCAVVLDPGNAIVSLSLSCPGILMHRRYFEILSGWMIAGLERIGVPGVRREGSCDLALGDRKIAGACIYRTRGLLHYGASLLVDPDFSLIERYLRHPPREPAYRRGRGHRDFLAGLAQLSAWRDAAQVARALAGVLAPPDLGRRA